MQTVSERKISPEENKRMRENYDRMKFITNVVSLEFYEKLGFSFMTPKTKVKLLV